MNTTVQPKYKLIFFNLRAKAEPIRWMFAYANIPFEDYRIMEKPPHRMADPSVRPEWTALKSKLPYGMVPVLEVDGDYLGDSHAIARYLAKPCGLAGADDWEEAEADAIITFIISSGKERNALHFNVLIIHILKETFNNIFVCWFVQRFDDLIY